MKRFVFIVVCALLSLACVFLFGLAWEAVLFINLGVFMVNLFYSTFKDSWKNGTKWIRLNETGELVQATVLSIKQTNIYSGDAPEVIMEIRIEEPDGSDYVTTVRGAIQVVDIPAYQPGKQIEVVRDREDREQVALKSPDFEKIQERRRKLKEVRTARKEKKMAGQVK